MATTTAAITLTSSDLLTDSLELTTTATLTNAGGTVGMSQTSGLARTNFTNNPIQSKAIFRSDDATTSGANKVYLKNISAITTEYFTIYIDQEEMGRLYAGDWAFFPWTATAGTKETFIVTATGTVAAGDSWEFDGITTTSADATLNNFAAAVNAQHFPNWTTAVSGAVVTFVAREAREDGVITGDAAITGDVLYDAAGSNFTMPITGGTAGAGSRSEADIMVVPSVVTTMDLEHMLFFQ